ncbi:MAG: EamA family transporter [Alphaproteobacteria bacterium]
MINHWLFWVFLSSAFGVAYHVSYKLVSGKFPPLLIAAISALVASIICGTLYSLMENKSEVMFPKTFSTLWPLLLMGFILAGLEITVLMIYKSGGPISLAQAMGSGTAVMITFTLGVFLFKEPLHLGQILGFFCTLTGVSLMTYFSGKQ